MFRQLSTKPSTHFYEKPRVAEQNMNEDYEPENNENINYEDKKEMNKFLNDNNPEFNENFELVEYIDSGSTGIVYMGKTKDQENNKLYSIKFCIRKNKNKNRNKSNYNEIKNQKQLHHKYISQILAFYKINAIDYFSVSELGKYGNLDNFLNKFLKKNNLSETFVNYLAKEILEALNYMHAKKYYHMDIKKANIVIDTELNIKLIDFSSTISCKNYQPNELFVFPKIGTGRYMSPEMLNQTQMEIKYGAKMDIYSLGVTLYNLAFGCFPYGLTNIKGNDYEKITEQLNKAELEFPKDIEVSKTFKNFLRKVLEKDYLKRYNTREALEDPWIKGWDIINDEKENTGNLENFIIKLICDNIPKFNQYIK